uniref:Pellino FHA domain-containing protein n=1 Tax=Cyprinus carpio TaxID=7962 RepID=A0A8C1SPK4_CYPCA
MDGLTTNGVLVMHPRHGFTEDSKPSVWREISVCGNVFTLRETRSAQQRGKMVSAQMLCMYINIASFMIW